MRYKYELEADNINVVWNSRVSICCTNL